MNLMDLFIKIGVDDKASGPIAKLTKAIGGGLATAAKIGAAAVGAAAVAVGKLGADAVKAYANYEQLVGGIETLFGDLSGNVLANADNAFKTVGLSANEYMETAMSFAASLNQSLMNTDGNIARSASITDMAIQDMADNANKMGTSMDSIQAAYAGFAKQNYTMLDNLKLGYGGTKQEMERLLADAEKITGVKYDINNFADIIAAIHAIQEELDITGTTAEESAKTVAGSFNTLKASWKNFLTGLGNKDADIGKLTDQLVESAETLLENLEPVVLQVLESLAGAVERLAPMIGEKLPKMIMRLAPSLIRAAIGLVGALAKAIPEMLSQIWTAVDEAISNSSFGERWASIKEAVSTAVEGIKESWDQLKEHAQPLIDKIKGAWNALKEWADENGVIEKAITAIGYVFKGIVLTLDDIVLAFNGVQWVAETVAAWVKEKWQPVATFFEGIAGTIASIMGAEPGSTYYGGQAGVGRALGGNGLWGGRGGRFAIGNDYVPYNGFPAILHRGEAVLTAREAEDWRQGNNGRGVQMVNNFYGVSQSDLDFIVAYVNRGLA